MRGFTHSVRWSGFFAVVALAACVPPGDSARSPLAEDRPAAPAAPAPRVEGDESMAALTAEIRQLRAAVEALTRSQTEVQALGVYLSAQQGRVLQATQLLDAARQELDSATAHNRDAQVQLTSVQDRIARVTDPQQRAMLEFEHRGTLSEATAAELQLQQARAREGDLSLALAREEDRWGDLLARLEQLTR